MLKKIKHLFKFYICCILIFSMFLPSYAALSASDGSAFVTKAEFDSALADFNSRLTTFEAGINSKIDSQVTSYLDRNGIWSGKDQLLSFTESDYVGILRGSPTITTYIHSYDRQSGTNGSRPKLQFTNNITNESMISNVNKSGLLWLNCIMEPKFDSTEFAGQIRIGSSQSDKYTFNNTGLLELWAAIEHESSGVAVREWLWQKLVQAFAGVTIYKSAYNSETFGISFFVTTGDKVMYSAGVNRSGTVDGFWDGGTVYWQYRLKVSSAKVY